MDFDNGNRAIGEEEVPQESIGSDSDTLPGSKKRKVRLSTEEMWKHLDKVNVEKPDGSVKPSAQCRYCDALISYDSTHGKYYLRKHAEDCVRKITAQIRKEDKDPVMDNRKDYVFDQAVATREAVRCIISEEQGFDMAETPAFVRFCTLANPRFKPIRSSIVRNVVMKFFEEEKPILQELLKTTPGKICISANLWIREEGRGYMCILAHYVDADWKLNKRVISFPALETDSSGNIEFVEGIRDSILDWGMGERIFTVTLDDTVAANSAERVKEVLLSNVSSVCKKLFHVPCGTQILNYIVQEGLEGFRQSIERIRESLRYVVYFEPQKFKELSKCNMWEFRKLCFEKSKHWNTTYRLLDATIPYQRSFELLFSDSTFHHIPTALDWKNATVMRDILKVFYESTELLAGSKYVSCSAFVHHLANMCLVLSSYEDDPSCSSVIAQMKAKLKNCFPEIPLALGLAVCMDPRYKILFLEVCLKQLFGDEETSDWGQRLEIVKSSLYELFEEYKQRFGANVSASTMEEKIEDDLTFAMFEKQEIRPCELDCYLQQPSLRVGDRKTFDVLRWWKEQEAHSPVVSAMARDLLTVPVSSVPLRWAFTGSRIVKQNRTIWPDEVIEATVCLKDWQDVAEGEQELQNPNIDEDKDDDAVMQGPQGMNVEAGDAGSDTNSDGNEDTMMHDSGSGSE